MSGGVGSLSEAALVAHIEGALSRGGAGVLAFHYEREVPAAELMISGGRRARVVRARSELAIRDAMRRRLADEVLVVVTPLRERDLGYDVLARVAERRLLAIDPWEPVRERVGALQVDPRLRNVPELAVALMGAGDRLGRASAPSYTEDEAWAAFEVAVLGFERAPERAGDLLVWAARCEGVVAERIAEGVADALARRWRARWGGVGALVVASVRGGDPQGALVAVDAALVLARGGRSDDREVLRSCGGLEARIEGRLTGLGSGLERAGEAELSAALAEAVDALGRGSEAVMCASARVDAELGRDAALLGRFGAFSQAGRASNVEALVDSAIAVARGEGELSELRDRRDALASHALTRPSDARGFEQVARLAAALGAGSDPETGDLAELAVWYADECGLRDAVRWWLTESDLGVAASRVATLLDLAMERADEANRRFAEAYSEAYRAALPAGVLAQSAVLDEVLAPLAESGPVLLVVMDGMGWAVAHELMRSEQLRGWEPFVPGHEGRHRPMLACVPSVTQFARTTLLSGEVVSGRDATEAKAFATHPGLTRVTGPLKPPVLFHKASVNDGRGAVGPELRSAIEDAGRRVVGVVVNAVDAQLKGSDQLRVEWSVAAIAPLPSLLELAGRTGRTVVLASDHGHVCEYRGARADVAPSPGRWRPIGSAPVGPGEIRFGGPNVRATAGADEVVVLWSERLRYSDAARGYHGGAALAEVVAPVIVLSPARSGEPPAGAGLVRWSPPEPSWWSVSAPLQPSAPQRARPATPREAKAARTGQLSLGVVPAATAGAGRAWIDLLVSSERYLERERALPSIARGAVPRRILEELDAAGGRLHVRQLAAALGMPAHRVQRTVVSLTTLFNVDGYPALELSPAEGAVKLDSARLRRQFGVEEP